MTVKAPTKSVYLAYSRVDPALAAEVKNRLAEDGLEIHSALNAAADYELAVRIREAIKESDVLVILATPAQIRSSWLTLEVGVAYALAKPIFLLTKDLPEESVPPHLQWIPRIAFEDVDKLAAAIQRSNRSSSSARTEDK